MHSGDFTIRRVHMPEAMFPSVVVAIPACNEADVIARCLRAIDCQRAPAGNALRQSIGAVCVINNSTDDSFAIAAAQAQTLSIPVRVYDVTMAPDARNAGGARRAAMDLAAEWLSEGGDRRGAVFTTDADSVPAPDWIATAREAMTRGADGVAGPIDLFPEDGAALPAHVQARGALEAQYEALLTEMFARLDPRPHDPWPCHASEAGANLAVTLHAYRTIGGLPRIACGEDRALVARLERYGFRVRHEPAMRVMTSGRLVGRATGGVADTIRLRCDEPEAVCDGYLEPAWNAWFRGFWRGRLRQIFAQDGPERAIIALGSRTQPVPTDGTFGTFWSAMEANDPRLARKLLRPADLPAEIATASVMVRRLRANAGADACRRPDDSPAFVPAE